VLKEELSRLWRFEERHRRLIARLTLASALSLLVYAIGTVLVWVFERGHGDIHGLGDAAFFTAVQMLTVSSSLSNPITVGGKIIDVILEGWGIFVITAIAGSFAAFFRAGDSTA
jgi:hypothetical protein